MYPSSNRLGIQFWVSKNYSNCILSMCVFVWEMCVFKEKKGHKQKGTMHTNTHKRWWWKLDMRKTRWHRVEHSFRAFLLLVVVVLLMLLLLMFSLDRSSSCFWLVCSNLHIFGLVETPIFGHIQTYYLFIWLKHNIFFFSLCRLSAPYPLHILLFFFFFRLCCHFYVCTKY